MKCPNCGNEVSPGEAFCGHCGTPMSPPTFATEMMPAPPPGGSLPGLIKTANPLAGQRTDNTGSGLLSTSQGLGRTGPFQSSPFTAGKPPAGRLPGQSNPNQTPLNSQGTGFYQDATEAISAFPGSGSRPDNFPPGNFTNTPPFQPGMNSTPNMGTGQFQPDPFAVQGQQFQPGTYLNNPTHTQYNFPSTTYGQGLPSGIPQRPPHRQSNTNLLLIAFGIIVVILLIITAVLVTRTNSQTAVNPTPKPTTAPTVASMPSPTATPTSMPSPTPSPTPTQVPTPAPDPGFAWCNTNCTNLNFQVEYPATWTASPTSISEQFVNPQQSEVIATFKKPGTPYADSTQALNGEMNTTYATQPGFQPPSGAGQGNTTIGGENWSYTTVHYTLNGQPARVEILATVHQGATYIIDLQAYEGEFDQFNQQYFSVMLGHFQFH